MSAFAKGSKALGICDRCGFSFLLKELKEETWNGKRRRNLVCRSCWDPDHPQNFLHKIKTNDPQALRNPRPDLEREASRNMEWGWRPLRGVIASVETGSFA